MTSHFFEDVLRLPAHWKLKEKALITRELLHIFDMENLANTLAGNLPYDAQRKAILRALWQHQPKAIFAVTRAQLRV